jgi:hypothetical protein
VKEGEYEMARKRPKGLTVGVMVELLCVMQKSNQGVVCARSKEPTTTKKKEKKV